MFTSIRLAPLRTCSMRDLDAALVVAGLDQPAELQRAGDVLALADHHEARLRA